MRNALRPFTLLLVLVLAVGSVSAAEFKIDRDHSDIVFAVEHLGVSKNYGRFNDISGSFDYNAETGALDSIVLEIPVASIDTRNGKRDQHLKGPDFFNAVEFPKITFKSTKVTAKGDGVYAVTGTLSLHGKTKTIELTLERIGHGKDPWGGFRAGAVTEFTIKRSDYGMTNMVGAVGDEVELLVNIEGIKQ